MDEDLFDGPALPVPEEPPIPRGSASYAPVVSGPAPKPVRHRAGYAPFAVFLASVGVDPRTTARDPLAMLAHLRAHHREIMVRPGLAQAAAVFFGNTLVAARQDAQWRGDRVNGPRQAIPPLNVLQRLGEARDQDLGRFTDLITVWSTAVYPQPLEFPSPTPPVPSIAYVRPAVVRLTVPETLGAVARGLATHARRNYAVTARDDLPAGSRLRPGAVWAAHLEPAAEDAAPLTLAAYGDGVALEAGVLFSRDFPQRNSLEADLTALEQTVLAVIGGWFAERMADPDPDWYEHALGFPDGSSSGKGGGQMAGLGAERLDAARARLASLPHGWQPWPLANDGHDSSIGRM